MIPTAVLAFATEVFKTINLHLEATPLDQRVAMAARWNSFWAQLSDGVLKPLGVNLPPMPEIAQGKDPSVR